MKNTHKRLATLFLSILVVSACGDDIMSFSEQFLIRRPTDSLIGTAPSYTASATGTDSLMFEWQPLSDATSYTIIFAQADSAASMNRLEGNLAEPQLSIPVPSPRLVQVPVNPADTLKPNFMSVEVVVHPVRSKDLDTALAALGVLPGGSMNTIFSIVAHRGSRDIRSIEVQRLILRRK